MILLSTMTWVWIATIVIIILFIIAGILDWYYWRNNSFLKKQEMKAARICLTKTDN